MIKCVTVAVAHGKIYEVGHEVNGVVIDDIIQNKSTNVIYCYDANSEILVEITANVPVVIEHVRDREVEND